LITTLRYLDLLESCGGFYECPLDSSGNRIGPLVGYTGRYGDEKKQYVGDVYANFAKIERSGAALDLVSNDLRLKILQNLGKDKISGFCGAPEGGKALAATMASFNRSTYSYIYPDRKVTKLKSESTRETVEFVFGRHEPIRGENYVIVEDICNNFSTTDELIRIIMNYGAYVLGIVCFLNRSMGVNNYYHFGTQTIPVVALVHKPFAEYTQEDREVAEHVLAGNVVWKPKDEWVRLQEAMHREA
jgi:orotate phosphoribosyltransferase